MNDYNSCPRGDCFKNFLEKKSTGGDARRNFKIRLEEKRIAWKRSVLQRDKEKGVRDDF